MLLQYFWKDSSYHTHTFRYSSVLANRSMLIQGIYKIYNGKKVIQSCICLKQLKYCCTCCVLKVWRKQGHTLHLWFLAESFHRSFCYLCICYCSNNVFVDLLCSIFPTLLYPSRCIHKIGMVPTLDTLNIQISNPRPMRRCIAGSVQDRDIKEVNSLL